MIIRDVFPTRVRSGYFNKDLPAIKAGPEADGFAYLGPPRTPGFSAIVQPGEGISVMLVLEDGSVGFGDCVDVILAGLAGRDPLFRADQHLGVIGGVVRDLLVGRDARRFRPLADAVEGFRHEGRLLHAAVRYGVSQALLHAAALANRVTMAEVAATEYGTSLPILPLPVLASCLTHDYLQIDRMIMKRAELLPHSSFHIAERDLGADGGKFLAYAEYLARRVRTLGGESYRPTIHLDVYGTIGELFAMDLDAVVDYLARTKAAVGELNLLIETPVLCASKAAQIEAFQTMRRKLRAKGVAVRLIADEWCNTLEDIREFADADAVDLAQVKTPDLGGIGNSIEAVLYCRNRGVGSYLGGSGNETEQSARVTAEIGLASGADFILSKPGFGGDEGLMIVSNAMQRALALAARRKAMPSAAP
jgi:methylaspartate ammonia-lyase